MSVGQPRGHELEECAVRVHVQDAVGLLHLDLRGVDLRQDVHLQLCGGGLRGLYGLRGDGGGRCGGLTGGVGCVVGQAGGEVCEQSALNTGFQAGEAADFAGALRETGTELVEHARVGSAGHRDLLTL